MDPFTFNLYSSDLYNDNKKTGDKFGGTKKLGIQNKPISAPNDNLPDFTVSGAWGENSINFKTNTVSFKQNPGAHKPNDKKFDFGIQTSSGWMNKDTLKKGAATILGMSEQHDVFGNTTRLANYANPNYRKEREVSEHDQNLSLYAGGDRGDDAVAAHNLHQAGINTRLTKASKAKVGNEMSEFATDPTIQYAQMIQKELGRDKLEVTTTRRREGRWSTDLSSVKASAEHIVRDYNEKQDVIGWAKEIKPGFGLDPTRKVTVVDKKSSEQQATYWTHNGRSRRTGYKTVDTSTYKNIFATDAKKGIKMDMLYDKIKIKAQSNKTRYSKYKEGMNTEMFQPLEKGMQQDITDATAKIAPSKIHFDKVMRGVQSKYAGKSQIGGTAYAKNQASAAKTKAAHENLIYDKEQKEDDLRLANISYFGISDKTFGELDEYKSRSKSNRKKYETYYNSDPNEDTYGFADITDDEFGAWESRKQNLLTGIDWRSSDQRHIIGDLKLDESKTIVQKDRSGHIIPDLEEVHNVLDDKATGLKGDIKEYDWQKRISQDEFGTDEISGDSHMSSVLDKYGGKIRGGDYFVQDIGKLIKKTKEHEGDLKQDILTKEIEILDTTISEDSNLPDYYIETHDKEYNVASKTYLEKSLELTEDERKQLEYQRRAALGIKSNAQALQYKVSQSRGRPSLKQKSQSSSQYKNKRTRGGRNNLGGLVI
jgi:hypothetical protein